MSARRTPERCPNENGGGLRCNGLRGHVGCCDCSVSGPAHDRWEARPWVPGRALVYDGNGQVEYFVRFENDPHMARQADGVCVRTACGGLRELSLCRPLDYVLERAVLRRLALPSLRRSIPAARGTR